MVTLTKYPTKPIQVWGKMKELRRKHFRRTWEARDRGGIVINGIVEAFLGLFAGFGEFGNPSYGPYFTVLMRNPDQLVKVLEAAESWGLNREICSSMRCHLGQLVSGLSTKNPNGGELVPDFCFQFNNCHSMAKTGQIFHEEQGLPYFVLDLPWKSRDIEMKYQVAQLNEAIEWMEKTTGKKFDDELLIEATNNEWEAAALYSRVCMRQKNTPAPYDMRQLWSLRLPLVTLRYEKDCVDYTRELLAETEERVREGISARGYETARFLQEGIPPFYHIQILRFPAEYGAIFVGGDILFASFGCWDFHEDGSWTVPLTPREKGIELKTRDDALWAQADLYLRHHPLSRNCCSPDRPEEVLKRAQDFHCDGVIIHLDRGCKGYQTGMLEAKQAVQKAGIAVTTYEASQADPRDFDNAKIYDHLESFMESLGLSKLPPEAQGGKEEAAD